MKRIAELLLEARMLKEIPRSGFHFLGAGRESVAEHVYAATFIGWVLAKLAPDVDALKLVSLCLVHDLPEARTGDLNSVQKAYVRADEPRAAADLVRGVVFGAELEALLAEYREGKSREARLARDADQLALILELKELDGIGYRPPQSWLPNVRRRLQTETARRLADEVMKIPRESWWWDAAVSSENEREAGS
jgi:putative hydrolase of HD superfamily